MSENTALDQGIGSWVARRARIAPADVALVEGERRVTYAELDRAVRRTTAALQVRGVARGDRVAYSGPNAVDFVVAMFATGSVGAVFVPLNTRLAAPEVAQILQVARPRLLLWATADDAVTTAEPVACLGIPCVMVTDGLERLWLEVDETSGGEPVPLGLDDPFMIQFTSGTTGRAKGVVLTHGNVTWNVVNLLLDVDVCRDEVSLVTAPLFHTAALNQVLMPTLMKGGTAVLEPRFDPDRALELVERHRVTMLFGVTTMYQALAASPGWRTRDLTSLRTVLSGGAPIPRTLLHTWLERGLTIIQGYGLTEASPGVTTLRPPEAVAHLGSAGTPCFYTDVRVVRPDLTDASPGEPGEVVVRGPNVTPGYWEAPLTTAEAFSDGWLRTGDLATRDSDGYVEIVGRLKDMIVSGGENIYPAEVEDAILTHPAVAQVAVVGVPDERWGEVGCAVVVTRPGHSLTLAELRAHLEPLLARYKIPTSVVTADDLPTTSSGKVIKSDVFQMRGASTTPSPEAT